MFRTKWNEGTAISIACLAVLFTPFGAHATGNDRVIFDPPVSGPAWTEPGQWRSKVQQVFDGRTRTLVRRAYEVWDPEPSRDLDFVWTPDRPELDRPGRINRNGHLVWRLKGLPSYDRESVFAEYRGMVRGGRIDGRGVYHDSTGLHYVGEWRAGLMHGRGTLKIPTGDEYTGEFRGGKANGRGRFIDVTGETFDGPFADGLRHGRGTTVLPSGVRYESSWVSGKEAEPSRLSRLAQSGSKGVPGGTDDIRIGVTIDKRLGSNRPAKGDLVYAISNGPDRLLIRPDDRRLVNLWKEGGEIQLTQEEERGEADWAGGVFSLPKAQVVPLILQIEVRNQSSRAASISGAYLDVQDSSTDNQPAIQLKVGALAGCGASAPEYRPRFTIENYGWGAAEQASIQFAFVRAGTKAHQNLQSISRPLGRLDRSIRVNLEDDLRRAGVNIDVLKRNAKTGFACKAAASQRCQIGDGRFGSNCRGVIDSCAQELRQSGVFGSLASQISFINTEIVLNASGMLRYGWQDSQGKSNQSASPFNAVFPIGFLKQELECGEGGERNVISRPTQKLRLDARRYRIPLSFQASLAAGRSERLSFAVGADKASHHDFTIVIQLADGREIRSRPLELMYFVPRPIPTSG